IQTSHLEASALDSIPTSYPPHSSLGRYIHHGRRTPKASGSSVRHCPPIPPAHNLLPPSIHLRTSVEPYHPALLPLSCHQPRHHHPPRMSAPRHLQGPRHCHHHILRHCQAPSDQGSGELPLGRGGELP